MFAKRPTQPPPPPPPPEDEVLHDYYSSEDDLSIEEHPDGDIPARNYDIRGPYLSAPPPGTREFLPPTPFAPIYRSTFLAGQEHKHLHPKLKYLNCSYLSTPGLAPSLTQLKQHAQALAVIIKEHTLSTRPVVIDSASSNGLKGAVSSPDGETWDWLNDLSVRYEGPKNEKLRYHHDLPLTSLLNVFEHVPSSHQATNDKQKDDEIDDPTSRHHCPLYAAESSLLTPQSSALPYATHQTLIAHANRALELLDHLYSAKGGLLAILPGENDKENREKAESTLLGQYILFTQRLVSRLHELEREYANSLDILKGEALVPLQTLSKLGSEGRVGRKVAYPQDRFVLVNAGEDVYGYLDREFVKKEIADRKLKADFLRQGVTGYKLWEKSPGGKEEEKGITAIDITTRYYRLTNNALKTIFVIPAWESHPGVSATVEIDSQPSVVSVVKPIWPDRQSLAEQRHRAELSHLRQLERENTELKQKAGYDEEAQTMLLADNELKRANIRELKRELAILTNDDAADAATRELHSKLAKLDETQKSAEANLAKAKAELESSNSELEKLKAERAAFEKDKVRWIEEFNLTKKGYEERFYEKVRMLQRLDREQARGVLEVEGVLKRVWGENVKEVGELVEWLRERKVRFEEDVVSEDVAEKGRERVEEELRAAGVDLDVHKGGNEGLLEARTQAVAPGTSGGKQRGGIQNLRGRLDNISQVDNRGIFTNTPTSAFTQTGHGRTVGTGAAATVESISSDEEEEESSVGLYTP